MQNRHYRLWTASGRHATLVVGIIAMLLVVGCRPEPVQPAPAVPAQPAVSVAATTVPTVVAAVPTYVAIAPAGVPPIVGAGALAVVPRGASEAIAPISADLGHGWMATAFVRPDPDVDLAVRLQVVSRPNHASEPPEQATAIELQLFDAGTGQALGGRPITLGVRPPTGIDLGRLAAYAQAETVQQALPSSRPPDAEALLISATSGSTVVVASPVESQGQPVAAVPGASVATAEPAEAQAPSIRAPLPSRMIVPALGIDAPIVPVGLEPSGIMASPPDGHLIGWYEPGPRPGEPSNAVLDGHADWSGQPAVFWRLKELKAGDEIVVRSGLDLRFRYVVTDVKQYRAEEAPLDEVFGATPEPTLTLITCGGEFDRGRREYEDRIVVRARAA